MPVYEYYCPKCDEVKELTFHMDDDRSNVSCPDCETEPLERVFGNLAVRIPEHFKATSSEMSPSEIGQRLNRSRPTGKRRSVY